MKKHELIESFADYADLSKAESARQLEWLFGKIMEEAENDAEGVSLPLLGKLKVVNTKERSGVTRGVAWTKPAGKKFRLQLGAFARDWFNNKE